MGEHCATCTCAPEEEVEDSLPTWLWLLMAIFTQLLCPHCGSVPFNEDGDHLESCPTLGTCAQVQPFWLPPWHPDPEDPDDWPRWWEQHRDEPHDIWVPAVPKP